MVQVVRDWQSLEALHELSLGELAVGEWARQTEVLYVIGDSGAYYTGVLGGVDPRPPDAFDLDGDGLWEVHVWVSPPLEQVRGYEVTVEGVRTLQLPNKYVQPGSEVIVINGQQKVRNADYSITYIDGVIQFMSAVTGIVSVTYTHGESVTGTVAIPPYEQLEDCTGNALARVWDIPHAVDQNRAAGHERDGIPVIVHVAIEPYTARARRLQGVDLLLKGDLYAGQY